MSWTKKSESIRSFTISFTVLSLFALCLFFGADFNTSEAKVAKGDTDANLGGTSFPGTGTGAIPDGPGVPTTCGSPGGPIVVSFDVTGLSGSITDITVDTDLTHSWVGDLTPTLTAPDGTTSHDLFGATGSTTAAGCGSGDDLAGVYSFNNAGTADWWALGTPYPPGLYQTTDPGGTVGDAGAVTDMTAAFAGLASANGTWTLSITDAGAGDTGTINAANLIITTDGGGPGPSLPPSNDYDGDGTTDYAQTRDESVTLRASSNKAFRARAYRERIKLRKENPITKPSVAPGDVGTNMGWYIHNSSDSTVFITGFGEPAFDFVTPSDFDGDGQTDLAVWRGSADPEFAFYILDSDTSTIREELFGIAGDDPTVVGDYDGDGSADVAVYRCPPTVAGTCTFFYRGSAGGGETTFQPWGNGTQATLFAYPGDFDGDGKFDFSVQRSLGGAMATGAPDSGQFVTLRSSDFGAEFQTFGYDTDFLAPGDYDGDGTTDYMVIRDNGTNLEWYALNSSDSSVTINTWGLSDDIPTPGDYDGDGKTDVSIWRFDTGDENNNYFFTLQSSDSALAAFEWGNGFDYPPANYAVK